MGTVMITTLTRFNQARTALAEARSIDEVKAVRDKAEALRLYTKQARESLAMQNDIAEIKLRAERRIGELLAEMEKRDGGDAMRVRARLQHETEVPPTLTDLGISKAQSSRWQLIAGLSEDKFEQHIAETKAGGKELTTAGVLRLAARERQPEPTETPARKESGELIRGMAGNYRLLNNGIKQCEQCQELWATDLDYCPYCHVSQEARIAHVQAERNSREAPEEKELIAVVQELRDEFGDDVTPERIRRVVTNRVRRIRREREAKVQSLKSPPIELPSEIDIRLGDFREVLDGVKGVHLILTDPPYPRKYLPLWSDLAKFATGVLRPDGLLLAYSGQFHLPEVLNRLSEHLAYMWMNALILQGPHNMVHARRVRSRWKPLLVFGRERQFVHAINGWVDDVYHSEGREKDFHEWQQSVGAAMHYIDLLTKPGDLVVDPFLGGGTTALAAMQLGRRFIGCDIDASAVAITRKRLNEPK